LNDVIKNKILLTGDVRTGKSTIISNCLQRAIAEYLITPNEIYGYKTAQIIKNGEISAFEITTLNSRESAIIASEDKMTPHIFRKFYVNTDAFDITIKKELEIFLARKGRLLVLDEIGLMEKFSPTYISFLSAILNEASLNVTGVLKMAADDEFLDKIKANENIETINVDLINRNFITDIFYEKINSILRPAA